MGHDISSYRVKVNIDFDKELHEGNGLEQGDEVSYLRFSAGNIVGQFLFYESLGAQGFNNGCSGNGDDEIFTLEQIKIAKAKLNYIATDDSISGQINNYSNEDKHRQFKALVSMFGGNPDDALLKENEERIKHEVEKINEFYDKILASGEEQIIIGFY